MRGAIVVVVVVGFFNLTHQYCTIFKNKNKNKNNQFCTNVRSDKPNYSIKYVGVFLIFLIFFLMCSLLTKTDVEFHSSSNFFGNPIHSKVSKEEGLFLFYLLGSTYWFSFSSSSILFYHLGAFRQIKRFFFFNSILHLEN